MTSEATSQAIELVDGTLHQTLAAVGLDPHYVRAEGNTMWAEGRDEGDVVAVTDFVGGYGSLLLGHNHPEIIGYATELLNAHTPIHSQFSRRPEANDVIARLTAIANREFGSDDTYFGVFANTGAEAIEASIKHAELARGLKARSLEAEISAHVEQARAAVANGAVVSPDALTERGLAGSGDARADLEALVAELTVHNSLALSKPPVIFSLEGAFHGKLVGSSQLTYNPNFRGAFSALAAQAQWVPVNTPDAVRPRFEAERATLLNLVAGDGVVEVEEIIAPVFCAFVAEPIQGEGGIVPLTPEFAKEITAVCAEFGCPVIVDEIQSGSGRTGAFFAGSHIGLQGDYITLAKSIGGGVSKLSIVLIKAEHYRPEFELTHSSTFARDLFSTLIARRTLEILETQDVYRLAAERGERLRSMIEAVRADYPDVLADVRGRGLLMGVELADQSNSASAAAAQAQQGGAFGYLASGFLLHNHQVRIQPTASAPNTLRLQPSVFLTDAQVDQLENGLRHLAEMVRNGDDAALTRHSVDRSF